MSRFLQGLRNASGANATPTSSGPNSISPSPINGASSSSSSSSNTSVHPSRSTSPSKTTTAAAASAVGKPTSHLIFHPHPSVRPPIPAPLSSEDEAKLARLRVQMEGLINTHYYLDDQGTKRPDGSKDPRGQLVEGWYEQWEWRWLDLEKGQGSTITRYLRASKGNEEEALKRLESSLLWRRSFKPDIIVPEEVKVEGETGKSLPLGYDVEGRVVLYLTPGKENTKSSERQIRFVVWGLERAIDLLPPYQSKLTLVIDFAHSSQAQNPSFATSLKVLSILQSHYVERLGLALCLNPPWYLNAFWSSVQPFMDPITKSKVRWNPAVETIREIIPKEQLPCYYGGEYNFVFDWEVIWKEMLEWCGIGEDGKRRHESWSRVGGRPGEVEDVQGQGQDTALVPVAEGLPSSDEKQTDA